MPWVLTEACRFVLTSLTPGVSLLGVLLRLLVVAAGVLSPCRAFAWSWWNEPQPVLDRSRNPLRADGGSPLAWDQSARRLWFVESGTLSSATWTPTGFTHSGRDQQLRPEAGLLVDSGLHFIFFVDRDGLPNRGRLVRGKWVAEPIGSEPVSRLLAVDPLRHILFAYDPAARGVRSYAYDARQKTWASSLIAADLGAAGDGGAFDAIRRVLYSSHESAPSTPKHPGATAIADPTNFGAFKPWPLVATAWSENGWNSEVLDETGVPQQAAVRPSDRRLFYAKRDELEASYFFQPQRDMLAESYGHVDGWAGANTFEDDERYVIRKPQYPSGWGVSAVQMGDLSYGAVWNTNVVIPVSFGPTMRGPITVVPVYEPIWTETNLSPRLSSFRALVDSKRSKLVQQRLSYSGEKLRVQSGSRVRYLYRSANGAYANSLHVDSRYVLSSQTTLATRSFPALGESFDPANPPAQFAQLASPDVVYIADPAFVPPFYSSAGDAAFVSPYLRLPTTANIRTFGHDYNSPYMQVGGRFRQYRNFGTDFAVPSGLAVDAPTGATFYTQAAPPAQYQEYETGTPPPRVTSGTSLQSGVSTPVPPQTVSSMYSPEPDPKLPRVPSRVWIVIVY